MDFFVPQPYHVMGTLPTYVEAILFQFEGVFFETTSPREIKDLQLYWILQSLIHQGVFLGIVSLLPKEVVVSHLTKLGILDFFSYAETSLVLAQEDILSQPSGELHLLTYGFLYALKINPFTYGHTIFVGSEGGPLTRLQEYLSFEACMVLVEQTEPVGALTEFVFQYLSTSTEDLPQSLQ